MDQEEEGIPNGWEELEGEEEVDVREHFQEVEKRWRRLKDKLIDQREGAMGRMEKRLKKVEESVAIVVTNMGKGTREQEKMCQKHDKKLREDREKAAEEKNKNQTIGEYRKKEKEMES